MEFLRELLRNDMLMRSVIAYFAAQFIKLFTILFRERRLDFHYLISSGGMPSSHASSVSALTFSCARVCGVSSPCFAICFVLAGVVLYDATGVRRAAGEHAKVLNQIVADHADETNRPDKELKELIGHTPFQVVIGTILGILIGSIRV